MSKYFLEGGRVKFELGLSNYATKTVLKNRTDLGLTSKFDKKC